MGCPVCSRSKSVSKAINNSFKKQDIQELLKRIKEQRKNDIKMVKN